MAARNDQKTAPQHEDYYAPPPPPGPPPSQPNPLGSNPNPNYTSHQQSVPSHPNETPIPDYYSTSHQQGQHQHQQQQPYHQPDENSLYGTGDPVPTTTTTQSAAQTSKPSWSSRFAGLSTKVSSPLNALANKMGSEAFLPDTMDKECEKAARILRGFCKDGIYTDPSAAAPGGVPQPQNPDFKPPPTIPASDPKKKEKKDRVLLTIPSKVIARAQGLAIFTTGRIGFHISGSSGSGVLIARLPDGSWSPPSGIQVHSLGAGFVAGLDIYDCVIVINSREALEAFKTTRMSLGSDLAVTAGPWGAGGAVDFGVPQGEGKGKGKGREEPSDHVFPADNKTSSATAPGGGAPLATPAVQGQGGTSKDRKPSPFREAMKKPVYSYVKSRGLFAGVQVDGTVITERKDANAVFYGDRNVTVDRILKGDVRPQSGDGLWPAAARGLMDVLKGAAGADSGWQGHGHGQGLHQGQPHGQHQGFAQGQQGQSVPHGTGYPTGGAYASGQDAGYGAPQGASGHVPSHRVAAYAPGAGPSGMTEGITQHRDVNPPATSSSGRASSPPLPPRDAKAAEAAAEARLYNEVPDGPPAYHDPGPAEVQQQQQQHHSRGEELPPAYVDDFGAPRPGVGDEKSATGHN